MKETDTSTHCTVKEYINIVKGINIKSAVWAGLSPEGVYRVMLRKQGSISCLEELFRIEEAGSPRKNFVSPIGGRGKCWEVQEGTPSNQILDIKGRLKSNIIFWRDFGGTNCPCITYLMHLV